MIRALLNSLNGHAKWDTSVCPWLFFWNAQKTIFLYPNATFNTTPVTGISKAAQNNWNPPSKVNIERPTAICLQKKIQKTNCCYLGVSPSHSRSGLNKEIMYDWKNYFLIPHDRRVINKWINFFEYNSMWSEKD